MSVWKRGAKEGGHYSSVNVCILMLLIEHLVHEVLRKTTRLLVAVKPLNSGHLLVLKNLSIIDRCPLLGGNLKKIVTFWTKWFVRYLRCPLLAGFTLVTSKYLSCIKYDLKKLYLGSVNKKLFLRLVDFGC